MFTKVVSDSSQTFAQRSRAVVKIVAGSFGETSSDEEFTKRKCRLSPSSDLESLSDSPNGRVQDRVYEIPIIGPQSPKDHLYSLPAISPEAGVSSPSRRAGPSVNTSPIYAQIDDGDDPIAQPIQLTASESSEPSSNQAISTPKRRKLSTTRNSKMTPSVLRRTPLQNSPAHSIENAYETPQSATGDGVTINVSPIYAQIIAASSPSATHRVPPTPNFARHPTLNRIPFNLPDGQPNKK